MFLKSMEQHILQNVAAKKTKELCKYKNDRQCALNRNKEFNCIFCCLKLRIRNIYLFIYFIHKLLKLASFAVTIRFFFLLFFFFVLELTAKGFL